GVYTISATPFTDIGDIDWPSVDSLVEFYVECGVQGLTVLGMMGEAQKLSDEESAEFTRHFLRRVNGRVPVIVGVSNPGTANLIRLANIAMDAGACGVMVAPLTGLKTEAQILTYFADVIAALGKTVPVVYQDYPQSTQADISTQNFLKIVDAHPSVVMFKHEDCPGLKKLTQIRKACDGVTRRYVSILVGNGGLYVPQELARGADGIMTGFAYPEMLGVVFGVVWGGPSRGGAGLVRLLSAAGAPGAAAGFRACRAQGIFAPARRHSLGGSARPGSQARRPRPSRARPAAVPPRDTLERKRQRPPARRRLAGM